MDTRKSERKPLGHYRGSCLHEDTAVQEGLVPPNDFCVIDTRIFAACYTSVKSEMIS
jgi:hypothetical protein